jgi:hypothetical protein
MKLIFFLLFSAATVIPMHIPIKCASEFTTFDDEIVEKMLHGSRKLIAKMGGYFCEAPPNACFQIYNDLLTQISTNRQLFLDDKNACEIQKEIINIVHSTDEYNSSLKTAIRLQRWDTYKCIARNLYVDELQKKGIKYPKNSGSHATFFIANNHLDSEKDYSLIKASIFLFYTPVQIQNNYIHEWFEQKNKRGNSGPIFERQWTLNDTQES